MSSGFQETPVSMQLCVELAGVTCAAVVVTVLARLVGFAVRARNLIAATGFVVVIALVVEVLLERSEIVSWISEILLDRSEIL